MEGKKHNRYWIAVLLILGFSFQTGFAKTKYQQQIYTAYIEGNMSQWRFVIAALEADPVKSVDGMLELINYYYGYTGYLISIKNHDLADHYIVKAEQLLSIILGKTPENSTALAYSGSFIGFKIGMDKFKAMRLGPKSLEYINRSITLDPLNPQGMLEKGNASYYTPRVFGGSKEEAIKYYQKAIRIYEQKNLQENNWMYLNALTVLAQAYEKTSQTAKAHEVYKKILRQEPEFQWVKNDLYPKFLKSSNL